MHRKSPHDSRADELSVNVSVSKNNIICCIRERGVKYFGSWTEEWLFIFTPPTGSVYVPLSGTNRSVKSMEIDTWHVHNRVERIYLIYKCTGQEPWTILNVISES